MRPCCWQAMRATCGCANVNANCPPNPPLAEVEKTKAGESRRYSYMDGDGYGPKLDIKLNAFHHAALFACTRWNNLYFPALGGFFG